MKLFTAITAIILLSLNSFINAASVNGRLIVLSSDNSKVSILLQINTNAGTDDMGGATMVLGFDNSLLGLPASLQRNTDYIFHNFSGGNYSLATVTRPLTSTIWVNIDLPSSNSNNGTVVAGGNEWTDVVTINFNLVNATDSINLWWMSSSPFWAVYDADNTTLWSTGTFTNFNGRINFDNDPPLLLNAVLLDLNTLELEFSEPLDNVSALNKNNYTISTGITVNNVAFNGYYDRVKLTTSGHSNGSTYTVTAQNIIDPAGNLICGNNNSKNYTCMHDATPPTLTGVTVNNTQTLTVRFSERLDVATASAKNNYSISGNISVNSVQLQPDSSGVVIKTGKMRDNTGYTLKVSNIKDRAGNIISPNPSYISYSTPQKGKGGAGKNKPISAKSGSWHLQFTADKTIDEKGMNFPASRWQSASGMPVSISYDFGETRWTDSLRISFYKWESGRLYQYSVYASEDSVNWIPVIESVWSEALEWTEIIFDSTLAKYLRIDILKSNQGPIASIWEVDFYGTDSPTSIETIDNIPESFMLKQNYPNPFNPGTIISWQLPVGGHQTLKVFDVLGNEVATLVDGYKEAGYHSIEFNSASVAGGLSSGVYIYRLTSGGHTESRKMILLR